MFRKLIKRERPRVYLGALAVAPRSDIKRHFEYWGLFEKEDMDSSLRQNLIEIFSLPPANEVHEPKGTDLVVDVVIPKFQSGEFLMDQGDTGFLIFWRPKVTVSSRLYYLRSGKTKATFTVTEKMEWREYFGRLFSWRYFFGFRPTFDAKDMEYLLYKACDKLLRKMQK